MPKRYGRNTLNSRCAASANSALNPVLPVHRRKRRRKEKPVEVVIESDVGGEEMSSNGDVAGPSKPPRTPRPRSSPESRNRSAMSTLAVDTSRNNDLNSDGTAPSSSNHVQLTPNSDAESEGPQREITVRRRRSKSHKRRTIITLQSRPRKLRTPSPQTSQASQDEGEPINFDAEGYDDTEEYQISGDMPDYILTAEHHDRFRSYIKKAKDKYNFEKEKIAELYSTSPTKNEDVPKLPGKIRIGKNTMESWYGSPFPREYVFAKRLEVCPFCLWYGRSTLIMAAHYKKCKLRSPPGVEIYRKDNHSVFEVDGHFDKIYCQNLCLISRLFLESKTVFHDTEPFMFYIVTINYDHGMEFAGYFSKEKYSPDRNNLSCIMTLPCHQGKGFGNFLIDLSYAISRKERWFGGPEEPLSTLGERAYHAYWKYKILKLLQKKKKKIEEGPGLSIKQLAKTTGIKPQTILDLLDTAKWLDYQKPAGSKKYIFNWNIDWALLEFYLKEEEEKMVGKVIFDKKFLQWKAFKHTPKLDGFVELSKTEMKADEESRKKKLLRTPLSAMKVHGTPTSSTSAPIGSVKKEIRSRSCRTVARNLNKELTKKVMVPDPSQVSDEEPKIQKKVVMVRKVRRRKGRRGKRRSGQQCADPSSDKSVTRRPDDDPDDAGAAPSKPKRRRRSKREGDGTVEPSTSEAPTTSSGGKGRRRTRTTGKPTYNNSDDGDSESSDDEQKPFGTRCQKGRKGRMGRKRAPKKFPPKSKENDGDNDGDDDDDEKKSDDDGNNGEKVRIAVTGKGEPSSSAKNDHEKSDFEDEKKLEQEKPRNSVITSTASLNDLGETEKSDADEKDSELEDEELEELGRDYIIGTPESYHSTPPVSPPPPLVPAPAPEDPASEILQDAQPLSVQVYEEPSFAEENDAAPPLLVSELQNLVVVESSEAQAIESAPPPLAAAGPAPDQDGYSTDDEAPPRLSPQFGKNEDHEEEQEKEKPPQVQMMGHNGMHHEEPQQYHNPLSVGNGQGPSSLQHMTPISFSQQMMTPQHPYSHQGPGSHQQTTPGSGGVPSCGVPVYNHSTPEQLQTQQQQQFMSPTMSGMPASVSSVHSVHNNSMEMVTGTAPLQQPHTSSQQPQYDMLGQMQQKVGNTAVANLEQQTQLMMAQHGFTSPPTQNGSISASIQQPVPLPAVPIPTAQTAAAAPRRRAKQRTRAPAASTASTQHQPALAVQQHAAMMMPTMPAMPFPYPYDYNSQMWGAAQFYHPFYQYPYAMNAATGTVDQQRQAWMLYQPQQQIPAQPQTAPAPAPMPAGGNQFPQQNAQWQPNPGYGN